MESGLFGIINSNRKPNEHWGKNCFNSSFPTALACYMMSRNIKAIYVKLDKNLNTICDEISIDDLFRCKDKNFENLEFDFETVFEPYQNYSYDKIDGIDLVVKDIKGNFLAPLEVKLTVLPDNSTCEKNQSEWGSELVVRSATTSYCAFMMYDSIKEKAKDVREIIEPYCANIESWTNNFEMSHKTADICNGLDEFEKKFYKFQRPLVMQTLWKTQGKSPLLADRAFDVVVWSDFAFSRIFIDDAKMPKETMTRQMRASAKLARCLWELCKSEKIRLTDIYRQMTYNNLTDREVSASGSKWRQYVNSPRLMNLSLKSDIVYKVIKEGYIEKLSPERRFDQTLYFTMRGGK